MDVKTEISLFNDNTVSGLDPKGWIQKFCQVGVLRQPQVLHTLTDSNKLQIT